jgi:hypothetical protein
MLQRKVYYFALHDVMAASKCCIFVQECIISNHPAQIDLLNDCVQVEEIYRSKE